MFEKPGEKRAAVQSSEVTSLVITVSLFFTIALRPYLLSLSLVQRLELQSSKRIKQDDPKGKAVAVVARK